MHFSKNQLILCRLFISYPKRAFYMQEIGRILEKKPGVFQKTLNNLERDGFVVSEFQANARFFRLNSSYPLLKEVLGIIKKTTPIINTFKNIINAKDLKHKKRKTLKTSINEISSKNFPQQNEKSELNEEKRKIFPTRLSDLHTEKPLTSLRHNFPSESENINIEKDDNMKNNEKVIVKNIESPTKPKPVNTVLVPKKEQLELF